MKIDELMNKHLFPDASNRQYPDFFHVISGGRHLLATPGFYEASAFSCCLVLYTNADALSFSAATQKKPVIRKLAQNSFLLVPPQTSFRLDILKPDTDFFYIAFEGKNLDSYLSEDIMNQGYLYLEDFPIDLLTILRRIFDASLQNYDALLFHRYLTDFLTELHFLQENRKAPESAVIPTYLLEIRHYLDHSYMEPISLKQLEERSGYSQYRICRAFTQHFGTSPLQYLNRLRIEKSKKLLVTSDIPIHEIGSLVGIDNTTHFINLFKRQEGMTPLVYRQNKK